MPSQACSQPPHRPTHIEQHISWVEDARTASAKANTKSPRHVAINRAHSSSKTTYPKSILQKSINSGLALIASLHQAWHSLCTDHHVQFLSNPHVCYFDSSYNAPLITFDSGAEGRYLSKANRISTHLPTLKPSIKQVSVTNGGTNKALHISRLSFLQHSDTAACADSFHDFPHSLMSIGKTSNDSNISIVTQDGVTVHKEHNVLITCKGEPILIGVSNEQRCYRITLTQHKGNWQHRSPSKKARLSLQQANIVYDLPSTEQAIKWMHAVCVYPVKSTWI
eukprot:CCRYP_015046-RA/>CCRYP_015046-RA protein AED:0.41 eAED:0.41 QI:0/-1/0/1/-1/1/1/0/279